MKRLVIIDGKSVFYRGYYAMGALSKSDGTPTGGIYGFAAIAMEVVKRLDPTKVVVAWDSKTSVAKRRAIYPDYKAGRAKPGDDFYAQIPDLEKLILALGWSFVEVDEYEADDIIGTLSLQADNDGNYDTYIVSSDLDMLQIVDENTRMYRLLKGFSSLEEIDVAAVEAKYGIKKAQFLDLKALKGDASDNIPGVPGIGEKTAAKLLNDYGDLDGIYAHIDEISGVTQKKLIAGRESAYMSRDLGRIMFDAPVNLADLPELEVDRERILAALNELEFKSLARKFFADSNTKTTERNNQNVAPDASRSVQGNLNFESQLDGSEAGKALKTPQNASEGQKTKAFDVEFPDIIAWDIKKLMHEDASIAQKILSGSATFWDLGQAEFLLNPLAREIHQSDEKMAYLRQQGEYQDYPKLLKVLTEFDLPLIPVLYQMEHEGMKIDCEYFARLKNRYSQEILTIEHEIWDLAGREFNINSPIQLSEILFEDLALPTKGIKKTTRGYSTGVKELDKLEKLHPIISAIKHYREAAKLLSTYIEPLPNLADENCRIHTTFTQNVTATGRLSSVNPNLQNIPVRTEAGRRIREGFSVEGSRILVSADYSQFELRLAAAMGGDQALIDDFNSGIDIHTKTASEAFGVEMGAVTKTQRRAAKVINFGILYGMSIRGLADAAKMDFAEAKQFIENYYQLRAPIMDYMKTTLAQAREQGFVETYFGRRRPTPDVLSSNFIVRSGAERAAQNMPIQGTEADLMKRAMIRVLEKLVEFNREKSQLERAKMVCQVHDSLIVECDQNDSEKISQILQSEMENIAPELLVKLAVDVSIGKNWGEL